MFDGALCVLATMLAVQRMSVSETMTPQQRQVVNHIAAAGGAVIFAYAMARGFDTTLMALAIAACTALVTVRLRPLPAHSPSMVLLAALGMASVQHGFAWPASAPGVMASGGLLAIAMIAGLQRVTFPALNTTVQRSLHFAAAAICSVIAYGAGLEANALSVVIIVAMIAMIAAFVTLAMTDSPRDHFIAAMHAYAACSLIALGVGVNNAAFVVTGVALMLASAAGCATFVVAGAPSKK